MFYTQSVFSSLHFIPSPYFIPSPQSVVCSPSFILTTYTTWKTCHQFNICWWKLLNCTNLMLENTLQPSLWRHVLNFIIGPKTLSTLFISTIIIIIIIIIIVQHRSTSTTLGLPKLWMAQPTCSRASPLMIVSSLSYWSTLNACTFISSSSHIFISQKSVNVWLPFVFSFLLDCSQSPIFSWDRLDTRRLTVNDGQCTKGAGVGDYSSGGGGVRKIEGL